VHSHGRQDAKTHSGIRNGEVIVLVVVIDKMKRLARVLDGIQMDVLDVSLQSPHAGNALQDIGPLCLGKIAECCPQRYVAIALGRDLNC